MAKKFVRGITDINQINQQDFDTNNVNDLLSDGEYNYIHRKKKDKSEEYHNLTDNIKTISSDNTDLVSVTNYNKSNNTATLHPHHDALKEQVIESTRNTIDIDYGENGTEETTKVDTNPQKVLEHDNLQAGANLTKTHTSGSNTTTLKVSDDFVERVTTVENNLTTVENKIPTTIGGRNLLKKTNQGKTGWNWIMQVGDSTIESVSSKGINAVKLTKGTETVHSGYSTIYCSNVLSKLIESDTQYVLSFDVYPSVNVTFKASITRSDGRSSLTNVATMNTAAANEWTKVSCILTGLHNLPENIGGEVVYLTGMSSANGVSYIIKNIKLEKDNIPTDWTPAPEDFTDEVSNLAPNQTIYGTRGQGLYAVQEVYGFRKTFYIEMTTQETTYTIPAENPLAGDLISAMGTTSKARNGYITLSINGTSITVENSSNITGVTDYAEFSFIDPDNQISHNSRNVRQ